jgi:hypothetical protein
MALPSYVRARLENLANYLNEEVNCIENLPLQLEFTDYNPLSRCGKHSGHFLKNEE